MFKIIRNVIIAVIALGLVCFALAIAPNYHLNYAKDKINLLINNSNVTMVLRADVIIENNKVYLGQADIQNFFDDYIYYEEDYNLVIANNATKIIEIKDFKNIEDTIYVSMNELDELYNIEVNYIEETKVVTIDSLDRMQQKSSVSKDADVKSLEKFLSRTIDKLNAGDEFIYISSENGYAEIRTKNGRLGYIKEDKLGQIIMVRKAKVEEKSDLKEKINLVWDNYYSVAPDREGEIIEGLNVVSPSFFDVIDIDGNIYDKTDENYIAWAKQNGYKIWPMLTNHELRIAETSVIMCDYMKRKALIENTLEMVEKYNLDGINLDFEYMYQEDVDMYSRLVIELAPRLREKGVTLSVDVTAPDGSENWSLCFDRPAIANNSDYIVFMAYDQRGSDGPVGTIAGHDWVEVSLKKFLKDIKPEKIILGIPFYTREWEEQNGELISSSTVDMKSIDYLITPDIPRVWDENLKQYYSEYELNGYTYKIWLEEEESIKAKLQLIVDNDLAGAGFWSKDREKPEIWNIIKEMLNK